VDRLCEEKVQERLQPKQDSKSSKNRRNHNRPQMPRHFPLRFLIKITLTQDINTVANNSL